MFSIKIIYDHYHWYELSTITITGMMQLRGSFGCQEGPSSESSDSKATGAWSVSWYSCTCIFTLGGWGQTLGEGISPANEPYQCSSRSKGS